MAGIDNRTAAPRAHFGRALPGQRAELPLRPPSPGFQPPGPLPAPEFETRQIIAQTFALMGRNTVLFLALVAAAAAPERILYHLIGGENLATLVLLTLVTALTCVPLYTAVSSAALADLRGEPLSFKGCLMAARHASFAANVLAAMTALWVWLLLIVPGVALAARWAVGVPVALVEGEDWDIALERSSLITRDRRSQVCVLVLLLAGLAISRGLTMMPVWGVPSEALPIFLIGNWLMPLLLTAFTAAGSAVLYCALVGNHPPIEPPA